jgi:hypothetical protein
LHHGSGHCNFSHRHQVVQRKVQTHAEHQQHHADFGQLSSHGHIGHKTWRERPNEHARQQVTYQRRQFHLGGQKAKDQRQAQASGNQRNQGSGVGHGHKFRQRLLT